MIAKVLNVYKPIGPTTFRLIEQLRQRLSEYKDEALGFAGRLDPMAEGVVLILVGEENKNRDKYLGLPKEYIFEVLFDFATDTYDAMGMVTASGNLPQNWQDSLKAEIENYKGEILQKFPPYSSKHIQGKALFQWAHEGRLDEIEIPVVKRKINSIELLETAKLSKADFAERVSKNIQKVEGDFRQEEILANWQKVLQNDARDFFNTAKIKISASSGTYMRSLAHDLGEKLGSSGLALSIKRTAVGNYTEEESLKL